MEVGTKSFIEKYIEKDHDKKLKDIKVNEFRSLKRHSDGKVDDALDMMVTYQPSEPEWAIKYKKDNYRAITKAPFKKVQNSIAKIQKARDLIITPSDKNSPKIKESETLYTYLFEKFPKYNNLLQWFFNYQIKNYLTDANGLVVIAPKYVLDDDYIEEYKDKPTNEFIQPIPYSFSITKVKYFDDDLLIIEVDKHEWLIVDTVNYYLLKRDHVKEKYTTTLLYSHNLGYVPAIENGGVLTSEDDDIYYESWVAGIIPDFDQALLENIDKNVTIKQHLYPERVEFTQNECTTCNGTGSISRTNSFGRNTTSSCHSCGGGGFSSGSPFGITKVRPAMGGEDSAIPAWAPVKYVEKDLKPVEFLTKDIDNLIKKGLGAVNMEFLAESPTDQSGISKAYDYDQTHNFLSNISNDVFGRLLPFIIDTTNRLRYSELLEFNDILLREQLPSINIPNDFDIVTASVIEEQIGKATQSGVSSSIIESMEMDYISKKYEGSPKELAYQQNIILLDALRGMTSDDIMTMNALTPFNPLTLITHSFINSFVERAFIENKDFASFELSRKKDIINKYAQEYKDFGNVTTQALNPLNSLDIPNDIEAEAKAKLKGSVGGVQGLIEIQQSVSAGTTQYESAIVMLQEIYGFDDVTARKLLGNPIDLRATNEQIK
jgi:hypothetical protein